MVCVEVRVLTGLILAVFVFAAPVLADSHADSVLAMLDQQDEWLAGSPSGVAWNEFLQTQVLREELAKGQDANKRLVAKVLGRYQSGVPGLEVARFQRTRNQLTAWADELRIPMALRWAERSRGAAFHHLPIHAEQIRQAKLELIEAMVSLDHFLGMSSVANAQAWKTFLKWDDLQQQLEADAPDSTKLNNVGGQYFDGHPGLELPEFVRVRNSLRKYLSLVTLSGQSDEALHKSMAAQLDALADAMEKYNDAPSVKSAGKTATLLDWLDQLGRLPTLAAEMRSYYRRPNVLVQVSEDFISRRFADTVDDTRPVDEMILKTHVRGNARTTGTVTADVVPSSHVAQIDIVLRGVTNTPSVGRQKPVTIYSHSRTTVEARKPLFVSPDGVTSGPANATCDTNTTIFRIVPDGHSGRRLIESIAWTRARQKNPIAERIASRRAEGRVEQQIDKRSREILDQTKQDLHEKLRGPLDRRGLIPDQIATSSSDSHVFLRATQANQAQLAALSDPSPCVLRR